MRASPSGRTTIIDYLGQAPRAGPLPDDLTDETLEACLSDANISILNAPYMHPRGMLPRNPHQHAEGCSGSKAVPEPTRPPRPLYPR